MEIERIRTRKIIKIGFETAKNRPYEFSFFFHEKKTKCGQGMISIFKADLRDAQYRSGWFRNGTEPRRVFCLALRLLILTWVTGCCCGTQVRVVLKWFCGCSLSCLTKNVIETILLNQNDAELPKRFILQSQS